MAEEKKYAYTTVPTNLRKLLQKIPTLGAPPKASQKWLASIGFAGGNNNTMLPVLRHLGVIDKSGAPTEYWVALRSGDKVKFADAVRKGYPDLFATYTDAHKQDSATLQTFFRTHTGLGDKAQSFCVRTFQVLAEFCDFSKPSRAKPAADAGESAGDADAIASEGGDAARRSASGPDHSGAPTPQPLALTVNLQIELPPSADGEVYDKLFAAMGKHLKGLITPPK
jgi:hypothetical protein